MKQYETLINTISDSIAWAQNTLSEDEGHILKELKEQQRLAKRLLASSKARPAVAIFGASQVGKSYLVSNLARLPDENELKVIIGNNNIDFIQDINPQGGRESTGALTRFTVINHFQPGKPPIRLKLLSQIDLVKILANGYLSDIDNRKDEITVELVRELFDHLNPASNSIDALTEDDIYDLKEYLTNNFATDYLVRLFSTTGLWDEMAQLVPKLKAQDRWQIFELFWGRTESLTKIFNKLMGGLRQLDFAQEAFCGKEALMPKEITVHGAQVTNTIIDVQLVNYLIEDNDPLEPLQVIGNQGASASLNRGLLTALVSEITLVLPPINHPKRSFFKEADVLDFPGARSREQIPASQLEKNDAEGQKAQIDVFLRGKVAFLFDNYAYYKNEISTLVLCLQDGPQEVKTIPSLVGNWVFRTHGETPEERSSSSLFVVFTKFNNDLKGKPSDKPGDPSSLNYIWDNRLRVNFNEEMSKAVEQPWPRIWDSKGTFKNCFWLRDPNFSTGVFDDSQREVKPEYTQKLKDMEMSYKTNPYVQQHFHNPEEAWKAAATPGNSGVEYIIEKITPTCSATVKEEQISKQFMALRKEVTNIIRPFYKAGDFDTLITEAKVDGDRIAKAIVAIMKRQNAFGLLLGELTVNDALAWKTYFDLDRPTDEEKNSLIFGVKLGDELDDLWDEAPSTTTHKSEQFAITLVSKWTSYLQEIYRTRDRLARTCLAKEDCQKLIQGISKAARRVNLVGEIAEAVHKEIENSAQNNIHLIARIATLQLNKMVNSVGWTMVTENERPKLKSGLPIFAKQTHTPPVTPTFQEGFAGNPIFIPWVVGIRNCYTANVNYDFNPEAKKDLTQMDVEANQRLGEILNQLT